MKQRHRGEERAVDAVQSVGASAPSALVASTIQAASMLAAGQAAAAGVISVQVVALTDGVMKAMWLAKLKSMIGVVMALGLLTAGGTSLVYRTLAEQPDRKPAIGAPTGRTAAVPDGNKPDAAKPQERNQAAAKDLRKIEPPGGVPLPLVVPGTNRIGVEQLNQVRRRLQSVPAKDLERWVVELERIMDEKWEDGLPSPRQACRTDFVVRLSVAFDNLRWNAPVADQLYRRACAMQPGDAKAWKAAFESVLKREIGIKKILKDEFASLPGGPPWAVPLVLLPVDAFHEGHKYSIARGKKYLARLNQLNRDDVTLWRTRMDRFGGTDLDAAVNIILLDNFFSKEKFQRERFKVALARSRQ